MSPFAHLLLALAVAGGAGGQASRVRADPEAIREAQRKEAAPRAASPRAIAHYLEARRLLADEEFDRAADAFRQAVVHDDASPELRLALAQALALAGRADAAAAEAKRAVALAHGEAIAADAHLLLGRLHADRGDLDAAILAVRQAVKLAAADADGRGDAPDPEPWHVLAELYAGSGDEAAAARALEDLAVRVPDAAGGFRELGRLLLERGELAPAEKRLRRAIEADRGDVEALRLLADVHERQRREGAAREDLLAVLALAPDDAPAPLALGRLALHDDDVAGARRWFERYLAAADDRVEARARLAFEWLDAMRPEEALAVVRDGGGDDARLRFAEGLALQGLRRWDESAIVLGAVRTTAGDLYRSARVSMAYALSRAGRHVEAERALAPALAARPAEARLLTMHALVLDRAGRVDEAVAVLRKALADRERAGGGAAELHEALAETLARAGRAGEALPALRRAVAAAPRDETLSYALGVAYDRAGQGEAAIAQMRALLAMNPAHPDALNFLAYQLAERGVRLEEAETLARRALELRPRSGYILDSLGWIHYRRGEFRRAVEVLERADALVGPEATILEHLGDAYRAAARPADAVTAYRRALGNLGDESPAQRARARAALERKLRVLDTPSPRT
jgi:Flp pilus assembly protein TadD